MIVVNMNCARLRRIMVYITEHLFALDQDESCHSYIKYFSSSSALCSGYV